MADDCSIVIAPIAPDGSVCEICGKSAPWQMYCKDCGHILRFYCDEHAYLSQGDERLEKLVKKAFNEQKELKNRMYKIAKEEWNFYLENVKKLNYNQ